jgi:hypothetical protein
MKKANKIISILALMLMLALSFTACTGDEVSLNGTATIVVEGRDGSYVTYDVDLSKLEKHDEGAISLLEYVASIEGSTLFYNVQWGGGYGAYITSIGALTPDASSNEYIGLYTSESEDFAVPTEYQPVVPTAVYSGKTLTYAGVGLSSMHVNDGTVILFRIDTY